MDRASALENARELRQKYPSMFRPLSEPNTTGTDIMEAASFTLQSNVQHFVELEGGGNKAFARMIRDNLHSPYLWEVRSFFPGDVSESRLFFTPTGELKGFKTKVPELEIGKNLTQEAALEIAEVRI
jgi:hypothetical protein